MSQPSAGSAGREAAAESQSMAAGFLPDPSKSLRGRPYWAWWAAVLVGVVALLGLAPAARLASEGLPTRSPDPDMTVLAASGSNLGGPSAPAAIHRSGPGLVQLPVGLPPGSTIATPSQIAPYARAALGAQGAAELLGFLRPNAEDLTATAKTRIPGDELNPAYPYRYAALQPILDAAPQGPFTRHALALGAALTLLAAQPDPRGNETISNAGPAAYAVLDRARPATGCPGQLDLLLLLSGDGNTPSAVLSAEEQRTETACPGDPTSGWVVGESQLRDLPSFDSAQSTTVDADNLRPLYAAISTFLRLTKEFPSIPASFTGLGDADLHAGLFLAISQPFTSRQDLRAAIEAYHRAAVLGDNSDAAMGTARAEIGLGHPAAAARLVEPFAQRSSRPGAALEVLIDAEETAHDFRAAAQAGRDLAAIGGRAYPPVAELYPAPEYGDIGQADDAALPLSTGASTLAALNDALVLTGGAGAGVEDLSFIPEYRNDPGLTGVDTACPAWSWRRDELLAGDPAATLDGWPRGFYDVRPGYDTACDTGNLELVAELAAHRKLGPTKVTRDELMDEWENVLRWADQLPAAQAVAEAWDRTDGATAAGAGAAIQLGEIDFLEQRPDAAAAEFDVAEQRIWLGSPPNSQELGQATVDRGAALLGAGRAAEATEILRPTPDALADDYDYEKAHSDSVGADQFAALAYDADEQLGDDERTSGDLHGAVEDYDAARRWLPLFTTRDGIRPEAVYNNEALAELGLGDTGTAAALEAKAVAIDPDDPVFLMGAGFIAERAGRTGEAISDNRKALQSDPGAFPAANDLGVELAGQHDDRAGESALRQAVGAEPGYALGWFNLGVLEARMGPRYLLASQGALARAYSLEPKLKDRKKELTIDGSIYRSTLDLSKPLPPDWSLAQTQRPAPAAAAGLLAVLLLAISLARAANPGSNDLAGKVVEPLNARLEKTKTVRGVQWAGWALAATVATFLLAYWRRTTSSTELAAYAVGIVVLAAVAMAARSVLAWRCALTVRQRSWVPGMVVGLIGGSLGLPWAPLPYVEGGGRRKRGLHQAAPIALAVTSALLFLESAWLQTPLTQSLAVAALVMTVSTLLPIAPLDGAGVGKAGVVAGVGAVGTAVLVGFGIL